MDTTTQQKLRDLVDASRAITQALEDLLDDANAVPESEGPAGEGPSVTNTQSGRRKVWDPEEDAPLVAPKVIGTREEQDWCSLTYLAGIYAINKRYKRGANKDEVRAYAVKAGYKDGRAVTAWSKGNGATQIDEHKQRWVNANGADYWVKGLAGKLGLTLPVDLAEPWEAPDFG